MGRQYVANVMGTPKSPKIRSITDKGNTSPKPLSNNTPKQSGFNNAFNGRTPKSNIKNNEQSKSEIKERSQEEKL